MQQFYNTDHISIKGNRLSLSHWKEIDSETLSNFEALSNWSHGMGMVIEYHERSIKWHLNICVELTLTVRVPILQITWQKWSTSVSSHLRMFFTLSADGISQHSRVSNKHLLLCEACSNQQILDRLHSMFNLRQNSDNGCFILNPQRPDWTALPYYFINRL